MGISSRETTRDTDNVDIMETPTYNELVMYVAQLEKDLAGQMLANAQLRTLILRRNVAKTVQNSKKSMILKAL